MPHTKRAFDAIDAKTITLKTKAGDPTSMLYIGWRSDCHPWWHRVLCPALGIKKIGILEIDGGNFNTAVAKAKEGHFGAVDYQVIHGDARKILEHVQPGTYDVIFWDHGPEHVSVDDLKIATQAIISAAGRLVIYCCPWGAWPQGATGGNEHEEHKNSIEPEQLTALGLNVVTFGESGQSMEGELFAFRFVGDYEGGNTV